MRTHARFRLVTGVVVEIHPRDVGKPWPDFRARVIRDCYSNQWFTVNETTTFNPAHIVAIDWVK